MIIAIAIAGSIAYVILGITGIKLGNKTVFKNDPLPPGLDIIMSLVWPIFWSVALIVGIGYYGSKWIQNG